MINPLGLVSLISLIILILVVNLNVSLTEVSPDVLYLLIKYHIKSCEVTSLYDISLVVTVPTNFIVLP